LTVGGIWHGQRDPTQFKVKSRINCQGRPMPLEAVPVCSPSEDESKLRAGYESDLDLAVRVPCYSALDDRQ
jgi:hypothetical protein